MNEVEREFGEGGGKEAVPKEKGAQPKQRLGGWTVSAHAGEMGMGERGEIVGGSGHWRAKVGGKDEAAPANPSEPCDHVCPLPQTFMRCSDTAQ